ncbi:hypothetical protein PanWU01x14_004080 [Parasponia andersonii]|uniref:Uncharacterized protein n=1 Tax=Parasponia andersonii TaxID=3476 RepID=A0A2P5E349_PARAD|nr:hypothetical protein PanWU01x14_004080 [Parasponia andersonii]
MCEKIAATRSIYVIWISLLRSRKLWVKGNGRSGLEVYVFEIVSPAGDGEVDGVEPKNTKNGLAPYVARTGEMVM